VEETASSQAFAKKYLSELKDVIDDLPIEDLARAMELIKGTLCSTKCVFLAGNGGSAATASHIANDLMKTVQKDCGKSVRAIALTDNTPVVTAIANDESFDEVFSGQLQILANAGDVLIVISGSGNSQNLVRAVETAKQMSLTTIGFLGMGGGKLADAVDIPVVVNSDDYGPIEDVHMIFDHLITAYLKES